MLTAAVEEWFKHRGALVVTRIRHVRTRVVGGLEKSVTALRIVVRTAADPVNVLDREIKLRQIAR